MQSQTSIDRISLNLDRAVDRAIDLAHALARDLERSGDRDLARNLNLERYLSLDRDLARDRDRDHSSTNTLVNMARGFRGVATLRSSLCCFEPPPPGTWSEPLLPLELLILSARVSIFQAEVHSKKLAASIVHAKHKGCDPFWIAFARHIARQSTPADRELLERLAAHPEEREPPLSWGLQYMIRGDILLDDGSEVTLDELCQEAGVPLYPLLEDMPPEIDSDTHSAR